MYTCRKAYWWAFIRKRFPTNTVLILFTDPLGERGMKQVRGSRTTDLNTTGKETECREEREVAIMSKRVKA